MPNEITDKWKSTKFQADDFMWNHSICGTEESGGRFQNSQKAFDKLPNAKYEV